MKKIIIFALALMLIFALAACNGDSGTDNDKDSGKDNGSSSTKDTTGDNANNNNNSNNNNNNSNDTPAQAGKVSGEQMEKAVANYLSKIGGPSSISLCGGSNIEYEPQNEFWTTWGESWTISDPDMTYIDLAFSVDNQLFAEGFTRSPGAVGSKWTVHAGVQSIGVMITEDGNNIVVYMTHFPDKYSMDFIAEQEAIMPKIIPGASALEALPENFLITWQDSSDYKYTLARKDGSWLYCSDGREADVSWEVTNAYYNAAILQGDGSYKYYEYTSENMNPSERDWFTSSNETIEKGLENILDYSGINDNGTLSTWLQMCKDYTDGTTLSANGRFTIAANMTVKGTETIAGVTCDVVATESVWVGYRELAYDPATGILFKHSLKESGSEDTVNKFIILEYDANPSTLGNYPG